MKRHVKPDRHRRGILFADILVAMTIAIALLMAMTIAVSTLRRGERRLADSRAGARRLETALWALQGTGPMDDGVAVEVLPGERANGRVWVRVSLHAPQTGGPGPSLVGLVPAQRVPQGGAR